MNEIKRLAYLEAMGIDSYVSRVPLPGAAPSRRLRIVRRRRPTMTPVPAATPHQAAVLSSARSELKSSLASTARDKPVDKPAPQAAEPTTTDIPIFSVAAVSLGGWYWLDEIPPGRELGTEYTRLLQAICRALGLPDENPVVEQFNWPLHNSSQLDQNEQAAQHGFSGFLGGRLERLRPRGVVLLGDLDATWFDPTPLDQLPTVTTVSAWQMLRKPALKAKAWSDLQTLRGDET